MKDLRRLRSVSSFRVRRRFFAISKAFKYGGEIRRGVRFELLGLVSY
jgi:hypothetical protein